MTRWWHYTLASKLLRIVADAHIRRAKLHVHGTERRAVWFSSRESWEPTATKRFMSSAGEGRPATIAEMVSFGGALVRLEVPESVARFTWSEHRKRGGIDARSANALEAAALKSGADPNEWRVTYHDVPMSAILAVEASQDGGEWSPVGEPSSTGEWLIDAKFLQIAKAVAHRDWFRPSTFRDR